MQKDLKNQNPFFTDERIKFIAGILITGFAFYLLLACISYLLWWKTDQSLPTSDVVSGPDIEVKNWSGKSGHFLAEMIIRYGFGFGAFFIPLIFGTIGLYLLRFPKIRPLNLILKFTFAAIITFSDAWICFWKVKCLSRQWSGRCSGIYGCQMDECFHGEDRYRCADLSHYCILPYFCLES